MPFSTLVGASISVKETCVGDLQLERSGELIYPPEPDEVGSQNSAVSPGLRWRCSWVEQASDALAGGGAGPSALLVGRRERWLCGLLKHQQHSEMTKNKLLTEERLTPLRDSKPSSHPS